MGQRRIIQAILYASIGTLAVTGSFAQSQTPDYQQDQAPHAWRRADDPATPSQQPQSDSDRGANVAFDQGGQQGPPPPPRYSANQGFGQGQQGQQDQQRQQGGRPMPAERPYEAVPPRLTIQPGTFVTVRMNQGLSSDHSQQGDAFFATLAQPLIVDGIVVAQRGQTVSGRVTEAQKAGRVEGTSRLGVELTSVTLADGQQLQLPSQMITRNGTTSNGRDAGAIAGTTALGAAIGAGADWGRGAAIGAGAGAAAGIIGVLLTRGHATVIYPESTLTFRVSAPAVVITDRAPQAFRYANTQDYNRDRYADRPAPRVANGAVPPPPPYYYGPSYYPYYGYYGAPGFSLFFGPRYYGYGGGFYYRGFRGRR